MQIHRAAEYVAEILNIKTENPYILNDILEELEQISDLKSFLGTLKAKTTTKEYQYLPPYQKFLKMALEYKLKNRGKIGLEIPVRKYSEKLYNKTVNVFDKVNWLVQTSPKATLNAFIIEKSFTEKELRALNKIGDKHRLFSLVRHNKPLLEEKIRNAVVDLSLKAREKQRVLGNNEINSNVLRMLNKSKKKVAIL